MQESQKFSSGGAVYLSPALQRWVKWKMTESQRDDTMIFTHPAPRRAIPNLAPVDRNPLLKPAEILQDPKSNAPRLLGMKLNSKHVVLLNRRGKTAAILTFRGSRHQQRHPLRVREGHKGFIRHS